MTVWISQDIRCPIAPTPRSTIPKYHVLTYAICESYYT